MSQLISAKEASRQTGFPYTSLRDAAQRGLIPIVRISRAWYFDRADLETFIAEHKERLS
jgi:hypothetical protein